jgi:hypothetical protein
MSPIISDSTTQPYWHILPLNKDRIDIFLFFNRVYPVVTKWMEHFFQSASWETDLHADLHNAEILRHFYFENRNRLKISGQHALAFGFPLIVDSDTFSGSEPIAVSAPLFIWHLNLKPHPNRRDSWLIGRDETSPLVVNEPILQFFQLKYNIDLKDKLSKFILSKNFSINAFDSLSKDLAKVLKYKTQHLNSGLRECPNQSLLRELSKSGDIAWAGVLGLFPSQALFLKQKNLSQVVETTFFKTTMKASIPTANTSTAFGRAEQMHEFTLLPEDAEQRAAFRTILRQRLSITEGGHGTGKTHLAANIALNAASNGRKTLIVAHDMATLIQIQQYFVDNGLGNLTFLLKDLLHDKKILLDSLRQEITTKTVPNQPFNLESYLITLKQARRWLQRLDNRTEALNRPVFGQERWADIVGRYVKSSQIAGRELLTNHLNPSDFTFKEDEYDFLKNEIETSDRLFVKAGTMKHPLTSLHPSLFRAASGGMSYRFVAEKVETYLKKLSFIQHRHIRMIDAYAQRLTDYYETHYGELYEQLQRLKEDISDYLFQFGNDFETTNFLKTSALQFMSVFSDRSKAILEAREKMVLAYQKLRDIFQSREYKYFEHPFLEGHERKNVPILRENLDNFEKSLQQWRIILPTMVQEQVNRLNGKTATHLDPHFAERVVELEHELDDLLSELNGINLYVSPIQHKVQSLPKRQLFVEETLERLEQTKQNLRDFETFFQWQEHWLAMSEKGKQIVKAIVKVKPSDWLSAFQSWYFHNILVVYNQRDITTGDDLAQQLMDASDKLRKMFPAQIALLWMERKNEVIRQLKKHNPPTYKHFFDTNNITLTRQIPLPKILKSNVEALTEIYPVLLMPPSVATELLKGEGNLFTNIIFENAHLIAKESVENLLVNTDGVVALCENTSNQTIAESEDWDVASLAAYAKAVGAPTVRLNHLHRHVSESVRALNRAIFYPDMRLPMCHPLGEQAAKVVHINNGRINEISQTNEAEITEIVRILQEINATPWKTYPRIGVITMTRQQRNSLNATLLNIVQKTLFGWEKIEHLQRNGLGIYNIDEIVGLQFDVVVVSGTYHILEMFTMSQRQLRMIANSFTQKIYWVNSVYKGELRNAAELPEKEVPYLISNILFYCEFLQKGETARYQYVLESLRKRYAHFKDEIPSPFVMQIAKIIGQDIGSRHINFDYPIDNQRFMLVITPRYVNQTPIVIRIDGRFTDDALKGMPFNADLERRILNQLTAMQVSIISIWSYDWWRDANAEAQKLKDAIAECDKPYL